MNPRETDAKMRFALVESCVEQIKVGIRLIGLILENGQQIESADRLVMYCNQIKFQLGVLHRSQEYYGVNPDLKVVFDNALAEVEPTADQTISTVDQLLGTSTAAVPGSSHRPASHAP